MSVLALAIGNAETGGPDTERIAREVRRFYDMHPYPPPVDDLDAYRRRWNDPERRRVDAHLFWPAEPYREDRNILVAGCGTSQAAKHALRWPRARVTGIDVSPTSIQCTEDLKRKYSLQNLDVLELPVEHAAELGRRFDQVVCTGVLHHLADPDAGLRALREVLKPDGAMHLMVYAPYGRAGIYMLQEYCRRLGLDSAREDIQDLVATLGALPNDHPLGNLLRRAPDFRSEAGLADALLHPRDRAYSVPQMLAFIDRSGLAFGRWLRQAPYLPGCGAISGTPHAPRIAELAAADAAAAMELFRGTMLQHSAVVYGSDRQVSSQSIGFAGDAWLDYVPLRVPDTICVEERLPPGASGVLINQAHTYTDIYLPIDAQEKQLFDAIDGERAIGEIAGKDRQLETARVLFERLWWYDQVVFDTSQTVARGIHRDGLPSP